jgi:hypothetical protein
MRPPLVVLAICCALAACTKDMRYRYLPDQDCGAKPCVNLPARLPGPGWELSFVEFNDRGEPWDSKQTDAAVDLIRQAKADNGGAAVVLLYVHGWKNNANDATPPQTKDVEKFKVALDAVAVTASRVAPPGRVPPLVGIYVGWRGGTLDTEPLKTITYWFRRPVARRVGRKGLLESVGRIIDAAKPPGDAQTKLILVGHSFGARVLENAVDGLDERGVRAGRMLAWQRSLPESTRGVSPPPPADLVVFVNAATQSTISGNTIDRLRAKGTVFYGPGGSVEGCKDDPTGNHRPECRPLPLYVALSSTGDVATRYVLPIANAVIPPAPLPLRLRSAAFTPRLRSHEVVEVPCPATTPFRCLPSGDRELCFEASREETRACYEMRRKPNAANQTPFWVMTVDPRVVQDHGDIWNRNLLDLFGAVLERTRAADVRATRVLMQR